MRLRPLSRRSFPSSSRMFCSSIFDVASTCIDSIFWKNPRCSPVYNVSSNSTTWRSKKQTIAALHILFSQLYACLTALRSCASVVSIFGGYQGACVASVAACSFAVIWASPTGERWQDPLWPQAGWQRCCSRWRDW